MVCKDEKRECFAFLSFEGISKDKPICDLGYIIEQVDGRWCNRDCKKFYNNISEYIKVKGGKSG